MTLGYPQLQHIFDSALGLVGLGLPTSQITALFKPDHPYEAPTEFCVLNLIDPGATEDPTQLHCPRISHAFPHNLPAMAPLTLSSKVAVPFRAQPPPARPSRARASVVPRAALDPSAALAVSQQVAAYAAVVGGEAAYTGLNTPAATPGRPSIPTTLIVAGGTTAVSAPPSRV